MLVSGVQLSDSYIIYIYIYACVHAKLLQSCPTLCNNMDCSPRGSSVHRILLAKILDWVAISFSRGSSLPGDGTPALEGGFFTASITWEVCVCVYTYIHTYMYTCIHTYTHTLFFRLFSHIGYHEILSIVPCAVQ